MARGGTGILIFLILGIIFLKVFGTSLMDLLIRGHLQILRDISLLDVFVFFFLKFYLGFGSFFMQDKR